MSHHVIEFDKRCQDCKGTGVYKGFAENDGFAVICFTCKGTGCYHTKYEYDDFEGKIFDSSIHTVLKTNPGIGIGIDKKQNLSKDSFGGMPYQDWWEGKEFPKKSEMRKFVCPAWWYQSADYNLKPNWKECNGHGIFSSCKKFCNKEECWEKFDQEHH
jgi:hypothetical protein